MNFRLATAVDAALVVAAAAALIVNGFVGTDHSVASKAAIVALALITAAPLAVRRRKPLASLLLVGAGLFLCLAFFGLYWAVIGVAMISLYTVAVRGDRRRSVLVGATIGVVLALTFGLLQATGSAPEGLVRLLLILGALVVGDTVRSRQALRRANVERGLQRERQHEQAELLRVEEERLRVARELHDTIAHALVAINVRAGVAAHLGTEDEDAVAFADIKQISADALHDLRQTLDLLREPDAHAPTQPAQDLADLPELFKRASAGGLDAQLDVRTDGTAIPSTVGQAAYRIVQESLTNVLRHAHATHARASIRVVGNILEIEVTDDGGGGPRNTGGHGLSGMTERARTLGGSVVAGPHTGAGWAVRAELPLGGHG